MTGYVKKFDDNVIMSFKISQKELLEKYDQIWKRIEKLPKIKFYSKTVYGDDEKYIKGKTKEYVDIVTTNFHNKKIMKEKAPRKGLSIIMLDSVIKVKKKYYPKKLLEECKYKEERMKIENLIDDDLEKNDSDNEFNDNDDTGK